MNFIKTGGREQEVPSYPTESSIRKHDINMDIQSHAHIESIVTNYHDNRYNTGPDNHEVPVSKLNPLYNPRQLSYGDRILDHEGNERYVIAVNNGKLQMTGKNKNLNNYTKAYTWSFDKFKQAVTGRGFRLANHKQ